MNPARYPADKKELLKNLRDDARYAQDQGERDFALALAYIINELGSDDRATKGVFS